MFRASALALVWVAASASAQTTTLKVIPPPADVAAPPADATKTATGLTSKVLQPGAGTIRPAKDDVVMVHWTGWTTDGKMFDSSVARGKPNTFRLDRAMAGWTEGLQLMVEGEKRRFWIPENLAYRGQQGRPKGTIVFDVELLGLPVRAPVDVKAPPADATRTASGLAYKVLVQGVGGRHPRPSSTVTVDYSGWTTEGKLFDSSVVSGQPAMFQLDGVIAGWTEGVALMVEGEKTRFWIPEKLAYKGGPPVKGDLVFDIELLRIN